MLVLLAEINGTPELDVRHAIKLKKSCEVMGIPHPVNIQTVENLIDILGNDKDQTCLLFSNFPPNSSYLGSGKAIKLVDEGDKISRSWPADSYSISHSLFQTLSKQYIFRDLHFITGAPESMLPDESITSIFPNIRLSIIRKREWLKSGQDYQLCYRLYIEDKIRETLSG